MIFASKVFNNTYSSGATHVSLNIFCKPRYFVSSMFTINENSFVLRYPGSLYQRFSTLSCLDPERVVWCDKYRNHHTGWSEGSPSQTSHILTFAKFSEHCTHSGHRKQHKRKVKNVQLLTRLCDTNGKRKMCQVCPRIALPHEASRLCFSSQCPNCTCRQICISANLFICPKFRFDA